MGKVGYFPLFYLASRLGMNLHSSPVFNTRLGVRRFSFVQQAGVRFCNYRGVICVRMFAGAAAFVTAQMEEEFDVSRGANKRGEHRRNNRPGSYLVDKRPQILQDLQMHRLIPDNATLAHFFASCFKLRFNQSQQICTLPNKRTKRWENQSKRNKRHVNRDQIDRFTDVFASEVTCV